MTQVTAVDNNPEASAAVEVSSFLDTTILHNWVSDMTQVTVVDNSLEAMVVIAEANKVAMVVTAEANKVAQGAADMVEETSRGEVEVDSGVALEVLKGRLNRPVRAISRRSSERWS
jgi:hypothetical protein